MVLQFQTVAALAPVLREDFDASVAEIGFLMAFILSRVLRWPCQEAQLGSDMGTNKSSFSDLR